MLVLNVADLYPLLGAATWAFSSAIIRKLDNYGSPAQLNFIRTGIGALLFLCHLILINQVEQLFEIPFLLVFYLFLSVLFNVALGDTLYFASQNRIGVKISTPIVNTYPLITILFAVFFLDEEVSLILLIGAIVIIIGIIALSIDRQVDSLGSIKQEPPHEWHLGLLFAFLATFLYALGIVYTTLGTEGLDPITANSVRLPVGTLLLVLIVFNQDRTRSPNSAQISLQEFLSHVKGMDRIVLSLLLISGILGTYISSLFLVLSVQAIGASRTAILFSVGPFFSLPLAVFWLKEKVGILTLLGTIATVLGLWLILS